MSRRRGLCCLGGCPGSGVGTVLTLLGPVAFGASAVCACASLVCADAVPHATRRPIIPRMIPAQRGRLTRLLMFRMRSTLVAHRLETPDTDCAGRLAMNGGSGKN